MYPNNYPNNQDCTSIVTFPQGQRIYVEFNAFNIESHSRCVYDWLEIYDGDSTSANLLSSRMCGDQIPSPLTSSGNTLFIKFHTDGSVQRSGFQLTVTVGKHNNFQVPNCEELINKS